MNVDLTPTLKDARHHLTIWRQRYSTIEYSQKVVLNIFYRKHTIAKMWSRVINERFQTREDAYQHNKIKYSEIAQYEIVPVLETLVRSEDKVATIRHSDFTHYIKLAAQGDSEALKGIEFTYFIHRLLDELTILWLSMVNAGLTPTGAITKITGAVLPPDLPVRSYAEIENIFDQLGVEEYLYSLFIKEGRN